MTRDRLMPISAAARRFSATASKLLPQSVFSKNSQAPTNTSAVTAMMKKLWYEPPIGPNSSRPMPKGTAPAAGRAES